MNAVAALIPSDAPISATVMAAFVLGTLALVFVALARRDREPGLAWLSAGFGLAAFWYAFEAGQPPADALLDTPGERFWAGVLILATAAMSLGVIAYLVDGRPRERAWWALLAPSLLALAPLALGFDVPRLLANLATMVCYIGLAVLAFRRSRDEPGHGHVLLGLTLLAVPCTFVALVALHAVPGHYRVLGVMPTLFFGMTLLTVSLLRRRRALEAEVARRAAAERALQDANHTLEATVHARTQSLQELVSNLEGFNRSVSHDLRGPLGGIAGLARLASDALGTGDLDMVHRSLAAISSQADTSTKLINALLQLARVGDAKLAPRTVALEALTRDVIAQLQLAPGDAAKAQWIVGALPDVQADADLLRPVLVNLITNALKFSRDAHPPIVRIEASVDAGEVTVHVRDNGVGFDTTAAAQLFEPFMRLHGRKFEGHGIGLSIVRRAVERHGGRVWAEAEPDHGAAFHFTLPKAA
jgi:signal transduction histidine kinase